jgi:folate-binding protein YgfZ
MRHGAILADRAVISIAGADARGFLQGLITNDMAECSPGRALYAGLLTPQGKLLFEFFVIEISPEHFLLDAAEARAEDLLKRLKLYRLRAKLVIERNELGVAVIWGGDLAEPLPGVTLFRDPRLSALGWRAIGEKGKLSSIADTTAEAYHRHRIALGVPDSADLPPEQIFPLDAGFEELNGVSFRKGCYVGQEVTARMKHRGTARRRLLIAEADPLPPPGTAILVEGRELGALSGGAGTMGLALVRLDRLAEAEGRNQPVTATGAPIVLRRPAWLRV